MSSRRRTATEEPPIPDDGTRPEPPADPQLATQDEIDAVITQANAHDGEQPAASADPVKRKRRTVLEIFADKKQEHADAVARTDAAVLLAQREHEAAIEAQEQFLAKARAAFGL